MNRRIVASIFSVVVVGLAVVATSSFPAFADGHDGGSSNGKCGDHGRSLAVSHDHGCPKCPGSPSGGTGGGSTTTSSTLGSTTTSSTLASTTTTSQTTSGEDSSDNRATAHDDNGCNPPPPCQPGGPGNSGGGSTTTSTPPTTIPPTTSTTSAPTSSTTVTTPTNSSLSPNVVATTSTTTPSTTSTTTPGPGAGNGCATAGQITAMINQFRIEAKTLGAMVGFGQDLENFVTAIVNSLSSFGIDTSQIASANTQYVTDLSTTQDSLTLASGQLGSLAGSQAPNQQLLTQGVH